MAARAYESGIALVEAAIEADARGQFRLAYGRYVEAIREFGRGTVNERDPLVRESVLSRVAAYMERAEQLADVLGEPARKTRPVAAELGTNQRHAQQRGAAEPAPLDRAGTATDSVAAAASLSDMVGVLEAEGIVRTATRLTPWHAVVGSVAATEALKEAVVTPAHFPPLFLGRELGWRAILLHGPPGCGKSFLADAACTEADCAVVALDAAQAAARAEGVPESLLRDLFSVARSRRPAVLLIENVDALSLPPPERPDGASGAEDMASQPAVVPSPAISFALVRADSMGFPVPVAGTRRDSTPPTTPAPPTAGGRAKGEEADARRRASVLAPVRGAREWAIRAHDHLCELLQDLPPQFEGLTVLTTSAIPWALSPRLRALLDRRLRVGLPHMETRAALVERALTEVPHSLSREDALVVAAETSGYSPRDIAGIVGEASREPLAHCQAARFFRRGEDGLLEPCHEHARGAQRMSLFDIRSDELRPPTVTLDDFRAVLGRSAPTVAAADAARYEVWAAEFGDDAW